MSAVLLWLVIRLAYLASGLFLLLLAGAWFHRRLDAYIDAHVRRALDVTDLNRYRAMRAHPSNCRKVEPLVRVR